MNNKAVIYFSRDGSTRIAAEILSEKLNAKLIELIEEKQSSSFIRAGFRAAAKKHSRLTGDPWSEIADCGTLVIGSPIWAGSGNPAVNGFLDKADLKGKKVFLFTVQADPNRDKSGEVLEHYARRIRESGGTVEGTLALQGARPGKRAEKESLKKALEQWRLP